MPATPLERETAFGLVSRLQSRTLGAEALARACLERCAAREPALKAWAWLDPDQVLAAARALDQGPLRGPLHGLPFGIKDVLDTADMPTEMGSPIYRGHRPRADAACVALVRSAGALALGKTVTAEFAGTAPGATVNPHHPAHTPGGSSSGSGAAVADFMVPVAFGSQTGGSVLRPAAFCGVIGFKPSFGRYNRTGLKPAADSLDTVGLIARHVGDLQLFDAVLTGAPVRDPQGLEAAPRIGICRTHLWPLAQPETVAAIDDAARRLSAAGATVVESPLPAHFEALTGIRATLNAYERARAMAWEWAHHRDALSQLMQRGVAQGLAVPLPDYRAACRVAETRRAEVAALFERVDILLTPCVPGEAPAGLASAGDPRLQELWTLLHLPSISLPTHAGPRGLPVGIQLVGARWDDERLLAAAAWTLERLGAWQ